MDTLKLREIEGRPSTSRSSGEASPTHLNTINSNQAWTNMSQHSSFTSFRGPLKVQGVVPRKMNSLSEDILGIVNKWHKERSGYQTTLNSFQVKSLGIISYRDTIAKCDLARDELMKARFKLAEEELARRAN